MVFDFKYDKVFQMTDEIYVGLELKFCDRSRPKAFFLRFNYVIF